MSKAIKRKKWDEIWKKGILEEEDSKGATDWEMVYPIGSDSKYGSKMYSATLGRFRNRTFSEFYGNGIVD